MHRATVVSSIDRDIVYMDKNADKMPELLVIRKMELCLYGKCLADSGTQDFLYKIGKVK